MCRESTSRTGNLKRGERRKLFQRQRTGEYGLGLVVIGQILLHTILFFSCHSRARSSSPSRLHEIEKLDTFPFISSENAALPVEEWQKKSFSLRFPRSCYPALYEGHVARRKALWEHFVRPNLE